MDDSADYNRNANGHDHADILDLANTSSSPGVSPLEQEVLDEYERLSRNMKEVSRLFEANVLLFAGRVAFSSTAAVLFRCHVPKAGCF
jgi:hypothetical protein